VARADNAPRSFKCRQCGTIFTARGETGACPICGFSCKATNCVVLEASDEGY
jgi:rubrerythrin